MPSRLRLFNAIIAIRWISLAVASLGYYRNLTTHEADYGYFIPVLAGAFLYTLVLSIFSRRIYEWRMRSALFVVIDYAVSIVAFSLTGDVWNPFLAFGSCSFAFAGLEGSKRAGYGGGIGLAVAYVISLAVKGYTWSSMIAADYLGLAFVYALEFVIFSIAWAFSVEILMRLDSACAEVAANRDHLTEANAALDERQRRLLALDRIRHAILLDLDAEEIIRITMRALDEMFSARHRMWLLQGGVLRVFPEEPGLAEIDAYSDHPLAVAAHDRETVVTEGAGRSDEGLPPPCVAVPVMTDADVLGVVAVENEEGDCPSEERIEALELFASQIALALEHVRLYERARDYAVAEERNRVTVEIHETVVRRMHDASVLADSLTEDDVPSDVRARLRLLKETILGSLQDLRFAVLNWSSLEWESTPRAMVERYVSEFTTLSGIPVTVESEGTERGVPASVAQDLLRILQESLSNVWRHADTDSVRARIDFQDEGIALSVDDDGTGFDAQAVAKGAGIGLRSIEERGARHDGTVEVTTAPGQGTRVRVWIPCR